MADTYIPTKDMFLFLLASFLLLFVIVVIVFFTGIYFDRDVETGSLNGYLLSSRLFYSPSCLSYNDGIRSYPGIVDLKNFDETRINDCVIYPNEQEGFKLVLKDSNGNEIKKVIVNKEQADKLEFCDIKTELFTCYREKFPLTIYDHGAYKIASLEIGVVRENV